MCIKLNSVLPRTAFGTHIPVSFLKLFDKDEIGSVIENFLKSASI